MRTIRFVAVCSATAIVASAIGLHAGALQAQSRSVDPPRWLQGCWQLSVGSRIVIEQWDAPAGGIMTGTSRTTVGGQPRGSEQLRLFVRADTLRYEAIPSGQRLTEFAARAVGQRELIFENLAHDFPQRIVYTRVGDDSLVARIEGDREGRRGPISFPFRKAPCATADAPAVRATPAVSSTPLEAIWYIRNNDEGIRSFEANARHVSIIAPQVYSIDSAGTIRGGTDPRIVRIAQQHHVKLVPLVMNPGFDLGILHHIVTNRTARTATARNMARICRDERVHGLQLDFENLHVGDRDAFTAFAREIADSVHRAGCELSAAVVPRTSDDRGVLPYHHWMYDYWRGAYDFKALAESLDFLSYMTYAQHAGGSTPGPVAGYPWMLAGLQYVLAQGVPPHKLSLGIPAYSDYWFPHYNPRTGDARVRGDDISYPALMTIITAAGARPTWDDEQKAWYAMWERHGVFEHAWLEDARAFESKLQLVRQYGLRGYSVWLMGLEDPATWGVVGPVLRR